MPDLNPYAPPPCPVMPPSPPPPPTLARFGDPVGPASPQTQGPGLGAGGPDYGPAFQDVFGGSGSSVLNLVAGEATFGDVRATSGSGRGSGNGSGKGSGATLEKTIPALAQHLVDLLVQSGPALDAAFATLLQETDDSPTGPAPDDQPSIYAQEAGDANTVTIRVDHLAPPPLVRLKPPLDVIPVDLERLAQLPPPPLSPGLKEALNPRLQVGLALEGSDEIHAHAATEPRVEELRDRLTELERFLGPLLVEWVESLVGFTSVRRGAEGIDWPALFESGRGSLVLPLLDLYGEYKIDYYGLMRALRMELDRRDPGDLRPLATEDDIDHFLTRKHGARMRSALLKLTRTAPVVGGGEALGTDRRWYSMGSLHERIGEGRYTNNQFLGEFIALQSTEGDLEVQKLQDRNPSGLNPFATYNRAIAVRMGRDVVLFDARNHELTVNDRPVSWRPGTFRLRGGTALMMQEDQIQLASARGDRLVITLNEGALDLSGVVSGSRPRRSVRGSLGSFDDEGVALIGSDGKVYSEHQVEEFMATWRPSRYERLFG